MTQFDTHERMRDTGHMPPRSSLNVSLTPELEKFIRNRVATGEYQTASEVIRESLRLLRRQENAAREEIRVLKKKLDRGVRQARRGEWVDGEQFFGRLFARLGQKSRKPPAA
jgi:antitoxin ParD1/3/4